MTIFEKIHIRGFRRLFDVEIKLKPLNIIIGANGSGKTSLLDVFSLLSASASGKLNEMLSDLGGIESNLTNLLIAKGQKERSMKFDMSLQLSRMTVDRALELLRGSKQKEIMIASILSRRLTGAQLNELKKRLTLNPSTGAKRTKMSDKPSANLATFQDMDTSPTAVAHTRRPSIEYHLELISDKNSYRIPEEIFTQFYEASKPFQHLQSINGVNKISRQDKHLAPDLEYNPKETALSQFPPKRFHEPEDFRKRLTSLTHYHVLDVGRRAPIRLPQQLRDAQLPGRDGEDLVSCLYTIRETDPDRFETIEATLRAGFPNFERLNFPPVAAGMLAMTWKDSTSKHPFYMHQLSEGTLRFLWLVTLLQSPGLTEITMIDEPEVSLHPELLSLLTDLFREASKRTQLIVATHADRLIRFLKPSEVLTINATDEGASEMIWADELDLEKWLEEYSLDEIWSNGQLGARA